MGICLHSESKAEPQPPLNYIMWGAKGHSMVVRDALDRYSCHLLGVLITIPALNPRFQTYLYFIYGRDLRGGSHHWICRHHWVL